MKGNLNKEQVMGLIPFDSLLSEAQMRAAGLGAASIDYVAEKISVACFGPGDWYATLRMQKSTAK